MKIGQDTLEHTIDWPASCQREGRRAEVRGMIQRAAQNWANYDVDKGTALMELMRSRGAAWVPTLAIAERVVQIGGHDGRAVDYDDLLACGGTGGILVKEATKGITPLTAEGLVTCAEQPLLAAQSSQDDEQVRLWCDLDDDAAWTTMQRWWRAWRTNPENCLTVSR